MKNKDLNRNVKTRKPTSPSFANFSYNSRYAR